MTMVCICDCCEWAKILDLSSKAATIIGVAGVIIAYLKYRKEREYGTYDSLDNKYMEYQGLCLQYPYLDVFDVRDETSIKNPQKSDSEIAKEELILFTMLFSIFERAYLLYKDKSGKLRKLQWTGWEEYIESYCKRPNFRKAWEKSGKTFDKKFQAYMKTKLGF